MMSGFHLKPERRFKLDTIYINTNTRSHSITDEYGIHECNTSFYSWWSSPFHSFDKKWNILFEFHISEWKFSNDRMYISLFVIFEFKSSSYEFFDDSFEIFSNSSSFWIWHKSFWSKNLCNFTHFFHHSWSCNCDIKINMTLKNAIDKIITTSYRYSHSFEFSFVANISKCSNTFCFTCSMRKRQSRSNYLIRLSRINRKVEMNFYCRIKFNSICSFEESNCLIKRIDSVWFNQTCSLVVLFSVYFRHNIKRWKNKLVQTFTIIGNSHLF